MTHYGHAVTRTTAPMTADQAFIPLAHPAAVEPGGFYMLAGRLVAKDAGGFWRLVAEGFELPVTEPGQFILADEYVRPRAEQHRVPDALQRWTDWPADGLFVERARRPKAHPAGTWLIRYHPAAPHDEPVFATVLGADHDDRCSVLRPADIVTP